MARLQSIGPFVEIGGLLVNREIKREIIVIISFVEKEIKKVI